MKLRRQSLLTEPPASATSDIAFILIIFFLVCASIQEEDGRPQEIPNSDKERQSKNPIRVNLDRQHIFLNKEQIAERKFKEKITDLLTQRVNEAEKTVAVRCDPAVPYDRWMKVTAWIENAGGTIALMRKQ